MKPVEGFLFQNLSLYRMLGLSRALGSNAEQVLMQAQQIRLHDWRILAVVQQRPGITATEARPLVMLNKMQTSRGVAHLVELGLLVASASASDGRAAALHLTAKGRQICRTASLRMAALEMWALQDLTAAELQSLDTVLAKVEQRVDQLPAPDAPALEAVYRATSERRRAAYLFRPRGEAKEASKP